MSIPNKTDQEVENAEDIENGPSFITTAAGCFAVFTICYALFNLITGQLGIRFDKDNLYWSLFLGAYLLVNVISWRLVNKYLN
jgi:hypothetical protein